uniref:Uncharacterized protein n=2 Tax=Timema TaxID=61471 RepID=A0A7R9IMG4_9NEOP|nr:unnamed protein product [Timema bartmani]CAD7460967.1 unnamed protein product [Timema tahoe]
MGNLHASESRRSASRFPPSFTRTEGICPTGDGKEPFRTPLPPPSPPLVPPSMRGRTEGTSDDATAADRGTRTMIENPGTLEELHKSCKGVFPALFEGARLVVNKNLNSNFQVRFISWAAQGWLFLLRTVPKMALVLYVQVSHTILLTSVAPSGYRFGGAYVGSQKNSEGDPTPLIMGDMNAGGGLNAQLAHQLGARVHLRMTTQMLRTRFNSAQFTVHYKGDDYTVSCVAGNPDFAKGTTILVGQYLQSVTSRVALGAELAHSYRRKVDTVVSGAARYTGDKATVSGTVGTRGLHLCYYQRASDKLQLGVELETDLHIKESVASLAYQVELPISSLCFRGMVDTNWNVGAVMEKKLNHAPFSFAISGTLNHARNTFRLGFGFMVE